MTDPIRSSSMGLPGSIRKKNPNVVVGSGTGAGGRVWNAKLGRMTGTHTIPPPGPERESRLFKMVDGVRTIGSEVIAAEERLADSDPVSTNKGKAKTSAPAGVSSDVNTTTTGTSTGSLLASIKSGLTAYMPVILVIGAVIVGIVVIKSAGKK